MKQRRHRTHPAQRERAQTRSASGPTAVAGDGTASVWIAIFATAAMFVVEFVAAAHTASVTLAVIAIRSGADLLVLATALATRRWLPERLRRADRRVDVAKAEALAGFVSGLLLLAASVPVAYHAVAGLLRPANPDLRTAMTVLGLGVGANIAVAAVLLWTTKRRSATESVGLVRLAVVNQLLDAEVSLLLLGGLAVADLCGWPLVDAAAALGGAFMISLSASNLATRTGAVLIEAGVEENPSTPPPP